MPADAGGEGAWEKEIFRVTGHAAGAGAGAGAGAAAAAAAAECLVAYLTPQAFRNMSRCSPVLGPPRPARISPLSSQNSLHPVCNEAV